MIAMLGQGDWTSALWAGVDYYGNTQFKTPQSMEGNLKSLVSYVETNPKAAPDMKPKLRFVVKELRHNTDARGVVVMLAAHAGVCNVQKEIGVRLAYSTMAETVKSDCDANDIRNAVLRVLYSLRELCIEALYCAQELRGNKSLNSHPLMGYRNPIAKQIGLDVVPDPDTSNSSVSPHYVETFFERFYTVECVLGCIRSAIADRKLSYNSVVSYLQYHRPPKFAASHLQEEFLYHCFDEEGRLTQGALVWMLHQMGILKLAADKALDETLLFPPLSEVALNASKGALARSASAMEVPLTVSQILERDEIRRSVEQAEHHKCSEDCDH